jgi:DNA polymerase elongation subunit (family B)
VPEGAIILSPVGSPAHPWGMDLSSYLIDIRMDKDRAKLFFKTENGKLETEHTYLPYFYAIANGNIEEAHHMINGHPLVHECKIEERIRSLISREFEQVIRIQTKNIYSFRKVIKDMRRVPGIIELAQTNIPHYLRFMLDKNLKFFHSYDSQLKPIEGKMPKMNMAAISGDCIASENGSCSTLKSTKDLHEFIGEQSIDAIVSNGLDLSIPGVLYIDLKKDMGYDIYSEDIALSDDIDFLLRFGRERLLRIVELSSITGARPDIVSSVTPGKLNTFLHIDSAMKNNHIVPDTKKSMERPKSLKMLEIMDKGGLIFYPEPGVYREVAKCDFASMYPNIIVNYNISPEMMHCRHDGCHDVPESLWKICKRRKGIIPQGIEKVLRRRLELKKLMKKESDPKKKRVYDVKQRALKNILVTCFGYLGFKNFIFSNVECKECVMLYGREILLRTKEIAEESGLEVIYGIVDSVFVKGGTKQQYEDFAARVSNEIGIELELDCIFRSIAFPAADDYAGIANKYYGITHEGKLECRGIALRHSDAPPLIKEFQEKAIRKILAGENASGIYRQYEEIILKKEPTLEQFAITKSLRRDPDKYIVDAPHVVAFRKLPNQEGIISFVYVRRGPVPVELSTKAELNLAKYLEILERSHSELLRGIEPKKKADCRLERFC